MAGIGEKWIPVQAVGKDIDHFTGFRIRPVKLQYGFGPARAAHRNLLWTGGFKLQFTEQLIGRHIGQFLDQAGVLNAAKLVQIDIECLRQPVQQTTRDPSFVMLDKVEIAD